MPIASYDIHKLNNPVYALHCLARGVAWLGRPQLRKFVIVPLLINLLLFAIALGLAVFYFSDFLDWLIPSWLDWVRWLLWPLFGLTFILITFFSFTLLANLLASPFYDKLAERTEELVTGSRPQPPEASLINAAVREMGAESRRLVYFVVRAFPLIILMVIPGINLISPFLWLLFNAWFLGLEYTAYPLANHGIFFPQQRQLLRKAKLGMLSLGGVILFGVGVPVLNVLIPPAAVIAATLYFLNARLTSSVIEGE